jgi:hypothetical protein
LEFSVSLFYKILHDFFLQNSPMFPAMHDGTFLNGTDVKLFYFKLGSTHTPMRFVYLYDKVKETREITNP